MPYQHGANPANMGRCNNCNPNVEHWNIVQYCVEADSCTINSRCSREDVQP